MVHDLYVPRSLCANCQRPGTAVCVNCRLVTYCDKECQGSHWKTHKADCKSLLRTGKWQPRWAVEQREPKWAAETLSAQVEAAGSAPITYLWGSMPALDVLQLKSHEGEASVMDLKLLFAASGDPRNLLKTLADIPPSYNGRLSITVNDCDAHVVARNIIIMLLIVTVDDMEAVSECIVHIWYSAFIRQVDLDLIHKHVLPPIVSHCQKIDTKPPDRLYSAKWQIKHSTLRLALGKGVWQTLMECLSVVPGLTIQDARQKRLAVVNLPEDQDYRDRTTIKQSPVHRPCLQKFIEDGVLLPFAHSREGFMIPNPTLFRRSTWALDRDAKPMTGCDSAQVMSTPCGSASNDLTGKLYCHVLSHVRSAHHYLSQKGADLDLFCMDAAKLSPLLSKSSFARIESSNLCDLNYLGTAKTIGCMSGLLQPPSVNPHAILITLFMGAVLDMHLLGMDQKPELKTVQDTLLKLWQYQVIYKNRATLEPLMVTASMFVRDHKPSFDQYCKMLGFPHIASQNGMNIRAQNTLTEKWPFVVKLKKGEPGFDEEFNLLFASSDIGIETYVEWARAK